MILVGSSDLLLLKKILKVPVKTGKKGQEERKK